MVNLVLNDLSRPAGIILCHLTQLFILILYADVPEAQGLPGTGKGKTAFISLVRAGLFENDRIEHDLRPAETSNMMIFFAMPIILAAIPTH